MSSFGYRRGILHAEDVPVPAIAVAAGTPTYVYSSAALRRNFHRLREAFSPLDPSIHYAVKANPNLAVLRLLGGLGAGMDVVSGGELERAWLAGTPMSEVVFAGVGKSEDEVRAALDGRHSPLRRDAGRFGVNDPAGRGAVGLFNVESESELRRIARCAEELGQRARYCLRVNPNVDPHTHEYTTTGKQENKFGIDADRIVDFVEQFAGEPSLEFRGLHAHIGSPVPEVEPYAESVAVLADLIDQLEARRIRTAVLNLGGGWPVSYVEGGAPPIEAYAERLIPLLRERVAAGLAVHLEPGRFLVADAGLLVARVEHVKAGKAKTFVIGDAGMHTLLRPALYRAFHFIWPVAWPGEAPPRREDTGLPGLRRCDIVGPICETGDFLARDRALPPLSQGDLLAVFTAGAYGMSMASNYNDHGRPAEVLVDGARARLVNARQPLAHLLETERAPADLDLGRHPGSGEAAEG